MATVAVNPGIGMLTGANLIGVGVGVWVSLAPWPEVVAVPVALATPLIGMALAAASGGTVSLGAVSALNRRPSLGGLVFGPMIGLGFFAYYGLRLFYWTQPAWVAAGAIAGVACALAFLIGRIDPKELGDQLMLVLTGIAVMAWGAGGVVALNRDLPSRARVPSPGVVSAKYHHSGRRYDSWDLTVRTADGQETFPIGPTTFARLSQDDRQCIFRTQGALGIWWKDFGDCPAQVRRAP